MPVADSVLLVDDIPDHVTAYRRALGEAGFAVVVATTAAEAVACVERAKPTCALIDVRLPDVSGWDLCSRLKARDDTGDLRIIILTSEVTKDAASDSRRAGCHAWIAHPSAPDALVRAVRHVLAHSDDVPSSPEEAMLTLLSCRACSADRVRATLRMGLIQYYSCQQCGFCWRVDTQPA